MLVAHNDQSILEGTIPVDAVVVAYDAPLPEPLTLALEDLIPDSRGEIVIINEGGNDIAVVTNQTVAAEGTAAAHVMESGLDVSGLHYCTFESGITVYYPGDQRLLISSDA